MSAAVGVGDADAEADDEEAGLGEDLLATDVEPQAASKTAIATAAYTALLIAVRLYNAVKPGSQLFHVGPVGSSLGVDLDPRLQLVSAGHDARHRLREAVDLGLRHLEQQLVMHLQQHAALHVVRLELAVQADHRDLDDVRGER